jgi:enoyl-CoA hydratase/carnithine racemase
MKVGILQELFTYKQNLEIFKTKDAQLKQELYLSFDQFKLIHYNHHNITKIIRFNDLSGMNTLNSYLCRELYNILINTSNDNLHVFIGEDSNRLFCLGGDLKFFYDSRDKLDQFLTFSNLWYHLLYILKERFSDNSVSIYNGIAIGGGMCIGINSKFRIATESTVMSMPETKFGFIPNCMFNTSVSKFLSYEEALHFSIFSLQFKGYEVFVKKLATHFILNKYIPDLLQDLSNIKNKSEAEGIIVSYHNKSISEIDEEIKIKYTKRLNSWDSVVKSLYNFDIDRSNFLDFYEKLKFNLQMNKSKLLKELLNRSLQSLQVNFSIINSAYDDNLSYEDRANKDINACALIIKSGNIFEGIRAYFIEKDNKPRWRVKF